MSLNKLNEYTDLLPRGMLADTPKAVFAAIVVSEYINRLNIEPENLGEAIIKEWQTLYDNGIIPQTPPNKHLHRTAQARFLTKISN